jgi:hypothetical protein
MPHLFHVRITHKSNLFNVTVLAVLSLVSATKIMAAADDQLDLVRGVPTNLSNVTAATNPPEWFNPLDASEQDLASFGFPPRPDANLDPIGYNSWRKAVAAAKHFVVPELEVSDIFHRPAADLQVENSTETSANWSAVALTNTSTSYNNTSSFKSIAAEYVVPVASQAYNSCSSDYSSTWVGLDGWTVTSASSTLLQAGTQSDSYCTANGQINTQAYYAWYEWLPNGTVTVTNMPISAGDDIYVHVWSTSATTGNIFIENYNTHQTVSMSLTAPAGARLVGNSAEWVIERPLVNGVVSNLTNYVSEYFSSCVAVDASGLTYTPSSPSAILTTMRNNGVPISYPTVLGTNAIQFQTEGPALLGQ